MDKLRERAKTQKEKQRKIKLEIFPPSLKERLAGANIVWFNWKVLWSFLMKKIPILFPPSRVSMVPWYIVLSAHPQQSEHPVKLPGKSSILRDK